MSKCDTKLTRNGGGKKEFLSPYLLKQVLMSWRKCFAFRLKSTIWNRRWIFCVVMSGQLIELSSVNIWGLIHPQVWYSIPNQWLGKKSLPKRKTEGVNLFKQLWGNLFPSKLSSFVSQIRSESLRSHLMNATEIKLRSEFVKWQWWRIH